MLFFVIICFLFPIIIFHKYIFLFFRVLNTKRKAYKESKIINDMYIKNLYSKRESVNNFNCYFDCTLKQATYIKSFLNTLPSFLGESFSCNNYQLQFLELPVFKKELSKRGQSIINWNGSETLGSFNPFKKSIIINANLPKTYLFETIAHELGHYCDWFLGPNNFVFYSKLDSDVLDEMERIKKLKCSHIGNYYLSNPHEFLAFCISHLFTDKLFPSDNMRNISEKYLLLLKENY